MSVTSFLHALNFRVIWHYRAAILGGIGTTCFLAIASFAIGAALGLALSLARLSSWRIAKAPAVVFIEIWRDTPLLVQALWIHFSLPFLTGFNTSPLQSGMIALSLNNAAYMAEIFRAGIGAVARGQWEAADALGLPVLSKWSAVILPQALRVVVPPLTSFAISVLKGTAIVSILAITELMRISTQINNVTFRPVEIFTFAGVVYLAIGTALYFGGKRLESMLRKGVPRP